MSKLSDVAARAGVSEATVSRVLNGRPGVSPVTREAVLVALDVMGYERPTRLVGAKGRLVGFMVSDITNPVFSAMAAAIGSRLAAEGFGTALCAVDINGDSLSEEDYIQLLLDQQVSGVIFAGGAFHNANTPPTRYEPLVERGIPTVLMNATKLDLPFPRVVCDDEQAAILSWQHLRSLGHTRIGLMLGSPEHVPSSIKRATVERLSAEAGTPLEPDLVAYTDYTVENAQGLALRLIREQGVTAIMCSSDLTALGVLRAAERLGLSVPRDISVVGYDDSLLMAHTGPPLTTLRQPVGRMSNAAVRALVAQVDNPGTIPSNHVYDPELILRGSTGLAPS